MSYRPRGTLARTLYDKIHNDQYVEGYDMRLVCINSHNLCNLLGVLFILCADKYDNI